MFRKKYEENGLEEYSEKRGVFKRLKSFLRGTKELVSDASEIQRDAAKGMYYAPITGAYIFSAALILTAIVDVVRGDYSFGAQKVATGLGLSYGLKRLSGRSLKSEAMPSI